MGIGIDTGIGFPGQSQPGQPGKAAPPPPHMTGVTFDKDVTGGKQYKMEFSDGTSYPFIVPEQAVDLSHLTDKYVPVYDAVSGELRDSDVSVTEHEVDMHADRLAFGSHVMRALGENVGFTNTATDITYAPLWQVYGANSKTGWIRAIGGKESVTRQADTSEVIINPDYQVTVDQDEMVHQTRFAFNEDTPGGIHLDIYLGVKKLFSQDVRQDFARGRQVVSWAPGLDLKKDQTYRIVLRRLDGQDLKLKGKDGFPFLQTVRSTWVDLVIADQKWVERLFVSISDFQKTQTALKQAQDLLKTLQQGQSGMQGDQATQGGEINALQKQVQGKLWTIADIVSHLKNLGYYPTNKGGGQQQPTHKTSAYAFFQADPVAPSKLDPGLPVYRDGRVQVTKATDDPEYVFIFLPPGEGTNVDKVSEAGGLSSVWAKESKSYGGRTYTVLRSPYPFVERNLTLFLHD